MTQRPISSHDARRLVRGAQLAAVGLGVSAAALWALNVPGLGKADLPAPATPAPAAAAEAEAPAGAGAAPARLDGESVAALAVRLDAARKIAPPPPPPPAATETPAETPAVAESPSDLRFIGTIRDPDRTMAIVQIEGQQLRVAAGQRVGKIEVIEVTPESVRIREGGVERDVARTARAEHAAVSWMRAPTGVAAGVAAAGLPPQPPPLPPGMSPEQAARLRERGIDPAQAARMRSEWSERRRNRNNRGASDDAPQPTPMNGAGVGGATNAPAPSENTSRWQRTRPTGENAPTTRGRALRLPGEDQN